MEAKEKTKVLQVIIVEEWETHEPSFNSFVVVDIFPEKGGYMRRKINHDKLEEFFIDSPWYDWNLPSDYDSKFIAFICEDGPLEELVIEFLNLEIV